MRVLLSILVLFYLDAAHSQECSDFDAQVLILGGGMAGVAAANRLKELGITDFIILEAQDRLGGRIRTEELVAGVDVSVGASWIHGVDPAQPRLHPLFDLAESCGGLEGFYSDYDSIMIYDSEGNNVSEDALRYDAYDNAREAGEEVATNAQDNGGPDHSIRELLTQQNWIPGSPEDNYVEWFGFDFCFAESPNVSSAFADLGDDTYTAFLASPDNEGLDYYITDSRGTPFLIDCLANKTSSDPNNDDRIRLGAEVTRIEYSDDCVCATATENGQDVTYCAPYAIVTFSTGVLKEGASTLFSPPLPEAKVNAVNLIVMALYYIVYSVFDERFWDNTQYIGYVHPDRGYFPLTQIVPPSRGVNATAMHVTEDLALRLSTLTEDELKTEVTQVFRSIYGSGVPEPNRILLKAWGTDPLFRGSYSNVRTGGSEMLEEMRRPEGRMYIAGEGTSPQFGYMQGAYFTGIDAANEIQERLSSGSKIVGNIALVLIVAACKMAM